MCITVSIREEHSGLSVINALTSFGILGPCYCCSFWAGCSCFVAVAFDYSALSCPWPDFWQEEPLVAERWEDRGKPTVANGSLERVHAPVESSNSGCSDHFQAASK